MFAAGVALLGTRAPLFRIKIFVEQKIVVPSQSEMSGCSSARNPMCLSFASCFRNMAMTWKVLQKNYVLDGYSICDSSAGNLFSMFDYRKQVITYFVKCIVYYAVKCIKEGNKFEEIIKSLKQMGWLVEFKVFEKVNLFLVTRKRTSIRVQHFTFTLILITIYIMSLHSIPNYSTIKAKDSKFYNQIRLKFKLEDSFLDKFRRTFLFWKPKTANFSQLVF